MLVNQLFVHSLAMYVRFLSSYSVERNSLKWREERLQVVPLDKFRKFENAHLAVGNAFTRKIITRRGYYCVPPSLQTYTH